MIDNNDSLFPRGDFLNRYVYAQLNNSCKFMNFEHENKEFLVPICNQTKKMWDKTKVEELVRSLNESLTVYDQLPNIIVSKAPYKMSQKEGCVYLIKSANDVYKIGMSMQLINRLINLQTSFPYDLELVHFIPTKHMKHLEKHFHDEFISSKIRGEWFNLTDEQVEYFKNFKLEQEGKARE